MGTTWGELVYSKATIRKKSRHLLLHSCGHQERTMWEPGFSSIHEHLGNTTWWLSSPRRKINITEPQFPRLCKTKLSWLTALVSIKSLDFVLVQMVPVPPLQHGNRTKNWTKAPGFDKVTKHTLKIQKVLFTQTINLLGRGRNTST
jgi:hypothetical protein